MKKQIILILTILCFQFTFAQTDWQKGYEKGFSEGYCYNDYGCVSPPAPPAIPNIGDSHNDYKAGYNKGFFEGQRVKQSKKTNSEINNRKRYETAEPKFVEDKMYKAPVDLMLKVLEAKERELEASQNENQNALKEKTKYLNPNNFAIINIYRPRKAMGSFLPVEVLINGESVAKLYSGGHLEYKIYDLTPKSITIKSAGIATINLVPSKNNTYFFQTNPRFSGFTLEKIASPVAENELKEKHYIQTSDFTF